MEEIISVLFVLNVTKLSLFIWLIRYLLFPVVLSVVDTVTPSPMALRTIPGLSVTVCGTVVGTYTSSSGPGVSYGVPGSTVVTPPKAPNTTVVIVPGVGVGPTGERGSGNVPYVVVGTGTRTAVFDMLPRE